MLKQRQRIRVPKKYCGQWIAWSHDRTRIVASGPTYEETRQTAEAAGEPQAYLTKAPKARGEFVGVNAFGAGLRHEREERSQ